MKHGFVSVPVGGGPAPRSEHGPQLQEEESPHHAARQTQGVPAAEGEAGGGQAEETEGGTEKTVPRYGPGGPEEAQVQSEGGAPGRLTRWIWTLQTETLVCSLDC